MAELRLVGVTKHYLKPWGGRGRRLPGGSFASRNVVSDSVVSGGSVEPGGSAGRVGFVRGGWGVSGGVWDVNLTVPSGKKLVLFGPSGSGKTTLLRLIAGVERVESGQIWLGDRDVTFAAPCQRTVSMVAQYPALYPHLTVRSNLEFGSSSSNASGVFDVIRRILSVPLRGLSRHAPETSVWEHRLQQVICNLRLTGLLDRFPHQLSGGERQRVALGRAMVREPAVFLFDEPMSAIDAQHRWQVRAELARMLSQSRATSVYVTHDFAEAMILGDQVAVMLDGVVQQLGAPEQVYRRPNSLAVARLFGRRGINELPVRWAGRWENGHFRLPPSFGWSVDGQAVTVPNRMLMGVRPESIQVLPSKPVGDGSERGLGCETEPLALWGRVAAIEALGCEQWLQVRLDADHFDVSLLESGQGGVDGPYGSQLWWVRLTDRGEFVAGGDGRWRLGERVRLGLCADQLQFFDATSGKSLGKEFNEAQ